LAISVAEVDQMSNGRVELGIGAGWYAAEHTAYGIPFPETRERFDRFEEQLAVVTGLWATADGETFSHDGTYYQVSDSPALPKPVQRPRPPVIIGGSGAKRTPALAARYADEFNLNFLEVEDGARQFARVRAACEAAGRDPGDLVYSAALTVCVGADETEFQRRAEAIGREPAELRAKGIAGTPQEARDRIAAYEGIGASRIYLQFLDLADHDHLRLIASELASA
jgi:alkanesulfonate monooxygenase SsuD/methylene tetrahydromethanopterin reductase-like flavin-dependent oxidoreductase (luciferase family)